MRAVVDGLGGGGAAVPRRGADDGGRRKRTAAKVDYVLDGDTIQVTTRDGREARVRLLGIGAPENDPAAQP